jgi:hypothetical protein
VYECVYVFVQDFKPSCYTRSKMDDAIDSASLYVYWSNCLLELTCGASCVVVCAGLSAVWLRTQQDERRGFPTSDREHPDLPH